MLTVALSDNTPSEPESKPLPRIHVTRADAPKAIAELLRQHPYPGKYLDEYSLALHLSKFVQYVDAKGSPCYWPTLVVRAYLRYQAIYGGGAV